MKGQGTGNGAVVAAISAEWRAQQALGSCAAGQAVSIPPPPLLARSCRYGRSGGVVRVSQMQRWIEGGVGP